MSDAATPNLTSRDFEKTSRFYAALGLSESWRDEGWMILKRGDLTLESSLILNSIPRPVGSVAVCGWMTLIPSTRRAKKPVCRRDAKVTRGCTLQRSSHGEAASAP